MNKSSPGKLRQNINFRGVTKEVGHNSTSHLYMTKKRVCVCVCICKTFHFLLFSHYGLLEWQNPDC